jgi:hypothetical protein
LNIQLKAPAKNYQGKNSWVKKNAHVEN